jgi:hypothetical protein
MSHDVLCPRSDGWQAYPQVLLQFLKSRPVLARYTVHSREASLTQIRCRERKECFNRLLCDDGGTHVGETTRMRPCLFMSAAVSVFCRSLFPSAHLLLQQLILLIPTHSTQTDLSPSPRKIHQVTGNTFHCLLSSDKLCRINSTKLLSSLRHSVSLNISTLFPFLILAPHCVSFSLKSVNFVSTGKNIFIISLRSLVKSVQGLGDVS